MIVKNKTKKELIVSLEESWELDRHDKPVPYRLIDKKDMEDMLSSLSEKNKVENNEKEEKFYAKEEDIMECTVIAVHDKSVIVSTGLKSEGVIPIQEFVESGDFNIEIGDKFEVLVSSVENENGSIVLSRKKAKSKRHWDMLCKTIDEEGTIVNGVVFRKTSGGFRVSLGCGIEGFVPNSQTGMSSEEFEKRYLSKECQFRPISVGMTNLILSTRDIIASSREERRRELLETMKVGDVIEGVVKNITSFGVFINVDNAVDGLIRMPDISYRRIKSPAEVDIAEGKVVKAVVLSNENGLVSFGIKQLQDNPWDSVEERFAVGSKVFGKAVNIMNYGVFVEVVPGIEGLVHFSEMPISHPISTLHEIISLGDAVEATVIYSNAKTSKLSLSMIRKNYSEINWESIEQKYAIGSTSTGIVRSLLKHCVIVELEPGVTAQVHVSDISSEQCSHSSSLLSIGEEVNVRILRISRSSGSDAFAPRKIVAGIRQYDMENWSDASAKEGDIVTATVSKITRFGAIADIGQGQRGYIHVSEMDVNANNKSKATDFVDVGDVVEAVIINVDSSQNMITLSMSKIDDTRSDFDAKESCK